MTQRLERSSVSRRLAYVVISVVFANYLGNAFFYVLQVSATFPRIAASLACLLTIGYLQLRVFSRPGADLRSSRAYLALGAMVLLVYVPMPFFPAAWPGMPGFLAGSALLVLPNRVRWLAFGAVVLSNGLIQSFYVPTLPLIGQAYYVVGATVSGLVVYGLSRLPTLVRQLETARSELAELAVSQERLRFARDLHDLLGFSLSAITLKVELARKLIGEHTDRALRELAEILGIAREALTDVRAVASSYRELSLSEEIESARSVLTAAGVAATIETCHPDLSPRSRTVLATVLREGVTNLLRHSNATRCAITIRGTDELVSIDIVNDGAPAEVSADRGSGLTNLATRTTAIGGSLLAQTAPGGTYRLHAEIPADSEPEKKPAPGVRTARPAIATTFAQVLLTSVVIGYLLTTTMLVLNEYARIGATGIVLTAAGVVGTVGLVLGVVSRPRIRLSLAQRCWVLGAIAAFVYVPQLVYGDPYLGLTGFLAGSAALVLPSRVGWPVFFAVVASQGVIFGVNGFDAVEIAYGVMAAMNHGLVLYALSRLRSMVTELHEAREELATAAVTQERFRFARDLHDLLGYSLSAITLKSELTHRLASIDPGRARQELTEVLEISRQALADVRSVALSYRELSFDEETQSAQALLSAADIEVTVRIDACDQLPTDVKVTLATVLREGVTNLLRHSKAEHCEIVLSSSRHLVTMDIVNDGIPSIERRSRDGSGIGNLTTRVRALGGDLHAGLTPEHTYRLRAEIPLPFN
ncbi:sensor histidine kinase [Lentzea californiensis]|uniref:sensor histidine kinase n=1 Tax=Lentzea californiensis TaxID=438851 RepID=UPI0021660052|nr:histidine kinase [Lentzea californiensis]MCR3751567.1 Signal transduction histidine kinase [Lentzea californiensis]